MNDTTEILTYAFGTFLMLNSSLGLYNIVKRAARAVAHE